MRDLAVGKPKGFCFGEQVTIHLLMAQIPPSKPHRPTACKTEPYALS
jgi:hypothetical protein